ncbi:hypothetical protein GTO91_03340 [Heliobacterium undosum]|uniref:Beta-lactamase class A catalytic domain-containing protein n=1 Tax=Heliomicrobium undosum TaxID=121734 RepID=A0A845KYS6_9FIRM|nr:serine hydrolase [Heliomicrobium undosum]MZP28743.1 hypothetical protein [Heliomicrobium undosum]
MAARMVASNVKRQALWVAGLLLLLASLAWGWLYWQQRQIAQLQFVLQLEETQKTTVATGPEYDKLRQRIRKDMAESGVDYALFLEDLKSGRQFTIEPDKNFQAASAIKVPLVLFLYALALDKRIDLDETMTLTSGDLAPSSGGLWSYRPGRQYTLRQLAKHVIEDSDNTATNMLMRRVGRSNFYLFLRLAGAHTVPAGPGKGNVTCARDMALYLKGIWIFRQLNPDYGEEMFQYLLHSKIDDRIPAGVPDHIKVANKIGSQIGFFHDAAIVMLPNRPYVLAILCHHPSETEANAAIARISRIIYEFQQSQPKAVQAISPYVP